MWSCPPDTVVLDSSGLHSNAMMVRYNVSGNSSSSSNGSIVGVVVGAGTSNGAGGADSAHHSQPHLLCVVVNNSSGDPLNEDLNKFSSALSPTIDILVACYLLVLGKIRPL
ncbi:hypothetical protein ElyMa_000487100 [Elysia marginata]|uniref:Uncharacterized protein n=1 Tax=Elysia marginata TaxID=1093978 RepID=A0AAV4FV33_9GAST|nr:hypothetical protein ElyMa_000487100 [Elysia marginata]